MPESNDPVLAVRVSDNERWDTVGRLYRKPDFKLPADWRKPDVLRGLIANNDLVPSVTNIIAVRSAPHLLGWTAKMVAEEAVRIVEQHPGLIQSKPGAAIKYLKATADRFRDAAGLQGTHIHEACELLGQNRSISHLQLTDYEYQSVEQFKRYLDLWQPQIKYTEVTGFGSVTTVGGETLGNAGTLDVIQEVNGKLMVGDYKCTLPSAQVLLPTGQSVRADELRVGQPIVAWTKAKGLHVAPVAYVGDNGVHEVIQITTASGHTLTTTTNHPYLASRATKQGFARADQLRVGDNVYLASGWNHSPARAGAPWDRTALPAPYLYGMLWSLFQFEADEVTADSVLALPGSARPNLREELEGSGFEFDENDNLTLTAGLTSIARVGKDAELNPAELLALLNAPTLHPALLAAPTNMIKGFFLGVQEVFANKAENAGEFMALFRNEVAARELQQAYLNDGQLVKYGSGRSAHYLEVEFTGRETVYVHGDAATAITSIERLAEPAGTLAIEVADAHTHVTAGLITHNTNRSGPHIDVALQLAAGARFEQITPDNQNLIEMPHVEDAAVIHISPRGVQFRRVNISERIYRKFAALREVWDFHAFESKYPLASEGVLGPILKSPSDF